MNKSITIIFIWSIFLGSILMQPAACFAQERELNPPTNLNATVIDDNDVTLTWDAPNSGGDPILLHWDSGVNEDSWGFWLSAEQFDVAAKWDPIHIASYDGWTITKLRYQYRITKRARLNVQLMMAVRSNLLLSAIWKPALPISKDNQTGP